MRNVNISKMWFILIKCCWGHSYNLCTQDAEQEDCLDFRVSLRSQWAQCCPRWLIMVGFTFVYWDDIWVLFHLVLLVFEGRTGSECEFLLAWNLICNPPYSNSRSSCLSLLCAGIIGMFHCTWLLYCFCFDQIKVSVRVILKGGFSLSFFFFLRHSRG